MNSREKLFFKNVELYRSMSLRKRMDEEEIELKRKRFREELVERKKKSREKKKETIYNRIMKYFVG